MIRILAIIAARNEENYINYSLKHFIDQNIDVFLIDNFSTDRTCEIAKKYLGKGLVGIEKINFDGFFNFKKILERKQSLAIELDYDWFIHSDADEIHDASEKFTNLYEGILDADRKRFNVINFEEFVFIPKNNNESFEGTDYTKKMKTYYFYEPRKQNLNRAWKKNNFINLVSSGGHNIILPEKKVYPINFILRHYISLSYDYIVNKYVSEKRQHVLNERLLGWGNDRYGYTKEDFNLDKKIKELKVYNFDKKFDRINPRHYHYWDHRVKKKNILSKLMKSFRRLVFLGLSKLFAEKENNFFYQKFLKIK